MVVYPIQILLRKEKYEEKISNLDDSSKLFLYRKLKTDIKLEDY
jgi:hypothetical protein